MDIYDEMDNEELGEDEMEILDYDDNIDLCCAGYCVED